MDAPRRVRGLAPRGRAKARSRSVCVNSRSVQSQRGSPGDGLGPSRGPPARFLRRKPERPPGEPSPKPVRVPRGPRPTSQGSAPGGPPCGPPSHTVRSLRPILLRGAAASRADESSPRGPEHASAHRRNDRRTARGTFSLTGRGETPRPDVRNRTSRPFWPTARTDRYRHSGPRA